MRTYLTALLCFISLFATAQTRTIEGTVTDAKDKSPLAFVNVVVKNTPRGTYTDANGYFKITLYENDKQLVISYLGYKTQEIILGGSNYLSISLRENGVTVDEIEVTPGINPADIIMEKVVENRDKHDPENLKTFEYNSYNKFVVGINLDNDTLHTSDTLKGFEDTLLYRMNLFLMESVTHKMYKKPGKVSETVLGSRISGLKTGAYVLLSTQLQSFSFYKNYVTLLEKEYLSPIAQGNTKKYLFILKDTVVQHGDSLYVIYYQPKKGKNFEGLTGILYIKTDTYAALKITASTADKEAGMQVQMIQEYSKLSDNTYFPTQFISDFIFKTATVSLNADSVGVNSQEKNSFYPKGQSRTKLYDIKIGEEIANRKFDNVELRYDKKALNQSDEFWTKNRQEHLDSKDSLTYVIIDSLGKEINLDRRLKWARALVTGKFPIGPIDVELTKLIAFNNFEGIRIGPAISTNDKLSRHFSVGGYYAYGFNDKRQHKYGGNLSWFFNSSQTSFFDISYKKDVTETGVQLNQLYQPTQEENYRNLFVNVMDRIEQTRAALNFRLLRYVKADVAISTANKWVTTSYRFGDGDGTYFKFTNAIISLRYAPGEKLVEVFGKLKAKESYKPVIYLTLNKGLKDMAGGQFDYLKADVMADFSFRLRNAGRSYFRLAGGYVDGAVPYTELYFGRASYNSRNISFASAYSFEAMKYNEFLNNQYAALFFRHDFGSLLLRTKKFAPEILVVTNILYGTLTNPEMHKFFNFKSADKGYFESGLQFNRLFKSGYSSYGFGVYYRYGTYSSDDAIKNFAIKLSTKFTL